MKTCITAPEPIEAKWGDVDGYVCGARLERGNLWLVTTAGGYSPTSTINPSPALLAFIQRAEAELLPKKKRSVGELTREDLKALARHGSELLTGAMYMKAVNTWATERNIQLPEGE